MYKNQILHRNTKYISRQSRSYYCYSPSDFYLPCHLEIIPGSVFPRITDSNALRIISFWTFGNTDRTAIYLRLKLWFLRLFYKLIGSAEPVMKIQQARFDINYGQSRIRGKNHLQPIVKTEFRYHITCYSGDTSYYWWPRIKSVWSQKFVCCIVSWWHFYWNDILQEQIKWFRNISFINMIIWKQLRVIYFIVFKSDT